jgi:hypothetical protein
MYKAMFGVISFCFALTSFAQVRAMPSNPTRRLVCDGEPMRTGIAYAIIMWNKKGGTIKFFDIEKRILGKTRLELVELKETEGNAFPFWIQLKPIQTLRIEKLDVEVLSIELKDDLTELVFEDAQASFEVPADSPFAQNSRRGIWMGCHASDL